MIFVDWRSLSACLVLPAASSLCRLEIERKRRGNSGPELERVLLGIDAVVDFRLLFSFPFFVVCLPFGKDVDGGFGDGKFLYVLGFYRKKCLEVRQLPKPLLT